MLLRLVRTMVVDVLRRLVFTWTSFFPSDFSLIWAEFVFLRVFAPLRRCALLYFEYALFVACRLCLTSVLSHSALTLLSDDYRCLRLPFFI